MSANHTSRNGDPAPTAPDRWAQLFEVLPLPMATLAADGRVLERNAAAWELGAPADLADPAGGTAPVSFADFVLPAYRQAVGSAIGAARERGRARGDAADQRGGG